MKIHRKGNLIEIEGIIKTMKDTEKIKEVLKEFKKGSSLIIRVIDSFAMPSAVIGNLLKKVEEGVDVRLEIKSPILYEVLDDLNLINRLNVKRLL